MEAEQILTEAYLVQVLWTGVRLETGLQRAQYRRDVKVSCSFILFDLALLDSEDVSERPGHFMDFTVFVHNTVINTVNCNPNRIFLHCGTCPVVLQMAVNVSGFYNTLLNHSTFVGATFLRPEKFLSHSKFTGTLCQLKTLMNL